MNNTPGTHKQFHQRLPTKESEETVAFVVAAGNQNNLRKSQSQLTPSMMQPAYGSGSTTDLELTPEQFAAYQAAQRSYSFIPLSSTSKDLPKKTITNKRNKQKRNSTGKDGKYHVNTAAKIPKFTGHFETNTEESSKSSNYETPVAANNSIVLKPMNSAIVKSIKKSLSSVKKPALIKTVCGGLPEGHKENIFSSHGTTPPLPQQIFVKSACGALPAGRKENNDSLEESFRGIIADPRNNMTPPLSQKFVAPSDYSNDSENEENSNPKSDDTEIIEQLKANVGEDILKQALNQSILYSQQYAAPIDETIDNGEDLAIDPRLLHHSNHNETQNEKEDNIAADAQMEDFPERLINEDDDRNRILPRDQVPVNQNQRNDNAPANQNRRNDNALANQNRRNSIVYLQEENYHPDKCCLGCKNTCIHILKSLIELKEAMQNNPNMAIIPSPTFDLLPRLPFENVEDLDNFDERLGDPQEADLADQFENLLASKGGNTLSKIVSRAMSVFITDELCKQITWTGVKNTLKAEIMNFPAIVIKVVRKQFACKESEAEEQIKDWLRRPSDRISQAAKTQRNKMMRQERRQRRRENQQHEN